jgi:exonuclease III
MAKDLDILFIQETKCVGIAAEEVLARCWRQSSFVYNDSKGAARGIAILWNPTIVVLDNFFSTTWTISARYRVMGSNKEGILTNAYGPQSPQEKDNFLKRLLVLGNLMDKKQWIIGGDFNIIISLEEKRGGIRRLDKDSETFQNLIEDLHLVDMEARNGIFTWTDKHSGTNQIACRLDHFLVSECFMLEGPLLEVNILPKAGSGHWSIHFWMDTISTPKPKSPDKGHEGHRNTCLTHTILTSTTRHGGHI